MKHLLNCRNCDWHTIVEDSFSLADVRRELHERSLRNRFSDDACPKDSVAWADYTTEPDTEGP